MSMFFVACSCKISTNYWVFVLPQESHPMDGMFISLFLNECICPYYFSKWTNLAFFVVIFIKNNIPKKSPFLFNHQENETIYFIKLPHFYILFKQVTNILKDFFKNLPSYLVYSQISRSPKWQHQKIEKKIVDQFDNKYIISKKLGIIYFFNSNFFLILKSKNLI
jgi:hypothetical protein